MVETALGVFWIYLMYRVGSIHVNTQGILRQLAEDSDAGKGHSPHKEQEQNNAEE